MVTDKLSLDFLCGDFLGLSRQDTVARLGGVPASRRRIYLDTTATSLMPRVIYDALRDYFEIANANSHTTAHRAGRITTEVIDTTRQAVGDWIGWDPKQDVLLLPGNGATGAINFLARALFPLELRMAIKRFPSGMPAALHSALKASLPEVASAMDDLAERPLVVTTLLEHHSNILPWVEAVGRHNLRTVRCLPDGRLDVDAMAHLLETEGHRVRLVAVTGASNVTGVLVPIFDIARMAHAVGARVLVDAAQLAPHRPLAMHPQDLGDDARLDFVALSGHKLYAPGSRGVLCGAFAPLERRRCIGDVGGGMVEYVSTEDFQVKDEITAREEAGTPNIPGTIALGMIARVLGGGVMEEVSRREEQLVVYAMERLRAVSGLRLFGPEDPSLRVGVFSFEMDTLPYGLVAAYLDDFHNIAVRDGCFCAHPYVKALLGVSASDEQRYLDEMHRGDRRRVPGMVRASLGLYSTRDDVDALCDALYELVRTRSRVEPLYQQGLDGSFRLSPSFRAPPTDPLFSLDTAADRLGRNCPVG